MFILHLQYDLLQALQEVFLGSLSPEDGETGGQLVHQESHHSGQPGSLDQIVQLPEGGTAGQSSQVAEQILLVVFVVKTSQSSRSLMVRIRRSRVSTISTRQRRLVVSVKRRGLKCPSEDDIVCSSERYIDGL